MRGEPLDRLAFRRRGCDLRGGIFLLFRSDFRSGGILIQTLLIFAVPLLHLFLELLLPLLHPLFELRALLLPLFAPLFELRPLFLPLFGPLLRPRLPVLGVLLFPQGPIFVVSVPKEDVRRDVHLRQGRNRRQNHVGRETRQRSEGRHHKQAPWPSRHGALGGAHRLFGVPHLLLSLPDSLFHFFAHFRAQLTRALLGQDQDRAA